ncbi:MULTISPECIES: hypothetical protein [unclassified Microcella]|uniref:hypothetical protein n=1 Tax=unclassified Microcella TaxID=2630066 RepID=UPI0006FF6AAB|nr:MULTISPECIES: hypothetical protein [unclassified Microcella]KQV26279.1 hypothetical protein ASC54_05095 [Yonghaparkia sp. Root332]KRF32938.1 hypothetical protein ASG83_02650 [Yonghaparkia sp. Soil809]
MTRDADLPDRAHLSRVVRWWVPAAATAVLAIVLIGVVIGLVRPPGPLDDPRPAYQRDGILRDGPVLAREVAGVPFGERTVVLLFERDAPTGAEWEEWRQDVSDDGVDLVLVPASVDGASALAAAVGMPVPVDGGPPVGYAVVDPDRQVRYATLDPKYLLNAFEVDVITGAVS